MSRAAQKAKDEARAAYMKKFPNRYPDSVMKSAAVAARWAHVPVTKNPGNSAWMRGMMGGILCARIGLGKANVSEDLI